MIDFTFCSPTEAIFGRGVEERVGAILKDKGAKKILLHYGGGSIKSSGLYDKVIGSLQAAELSWVELGGVVPNPHLSLVHEGIRLCRALEVDFILAVGGGSVIDSAKAIATGALYEGDVWDFHSGKAVSTKSLPLGTILTIPAAGSEASDSCVITNDLDGNVKRGSKSQFNRPTFSLYNPELTFTLSPYQTACGVTDMFAHIVERYFTNTPDVDYSDMLCEASMKTILKFGTVAVRQPDDYNARAQLMWASTIAHNNLLGMDREQDWSSHQISHELSGEFDVAHGAALAVLVPAWMRFVYRHDIMRFCRFAVEVMGQPMDYFHPEQTARNGIDALRKYFTSIGMPATLTELGIRNADLHELATRVKKTNPAGKTGFFVPLSESDIEEILHSVV